MKKNIILFFILIMFSTITNAKTLFLGDSLTQKIGENYKQKYKETELNYVIGSGIENKKVDWFEKINNIDLNRYKKIVISLGTNDWGIYNENSYNVKIEKFISIIKKKNNNINILWILPPTIKNEKINSGVLKVKNIIKKVCNEKNIDFFDPNSIWGDKYIYSINGWETRTKDGIHYTNYGAKLIAEKIKE